LVPRWCPRRCSEILTIAQIEKAEPPAEGRIVVWDNDLPGFGCRVFPSGQRSFIVCYRLPGSLKKQTATIGTYGLITLRQARQKAQEILVRARLGGDPQAERKACAEAEERLTLYQMVSRYVDALKAGTASSKRLKGRAASTGYIEDTVRYLELLTGAHGRQAAASLARGDVVRLLDGYAGRPATQRQLHGAISRLYAWARRSELVAIDPAADIETTTAAPRERVLSLVELGMVGGILARSAVPGSRAPDDPDRAAARRGRRHAVARDRPRAGAVDAARRPDQGTAAARHSAACGRCGDPPGPATDG
jgi:hypothetical protein